MYTFSIEKKKENNIEEIKNYMRFTTKIIHKPVTQHIYGQKIERKAPINEMYDIWEEYVDKEGKYHKNEYLVYEGK